ncbi:MAG: hypothetical protein ABIH24_04620 [Verrucomicrobiota bacterium]
MKIITSVCTMLIAAALCGCTSTRVSRLLHEKDVQIKDIETSKAALEQDLSSQKEIEQTLRLEKQALAEDGAAVRREVRSFVKAQMQALRDFSENKALLDYVGGELIARAHVSGKNLLLVDLQHPMPSAGILLGGKLLVNGKTDAAFCILRPRGKDLVVVWMAEVSAIPKTGLSSVAFNTPVAVEKGDLIGLYSPAAAQVPFTRGTGDTRTLAGPIKPGQAIPIEALEQDNGRGYSFGVVGFLD